MSQGEPNVEPFDAEADHAHWARLFESLWPTDASEPAVGPFRIWIAGCRSPRAIRNLLAHLSRWSQDQPRGRHRIFLSDDDPSAVENLRKVLERSGLEAGGFDRAGLDRAGLDRAGLDRAGIRRDRGERGRGGNGAAKIGAGQTRRTGRAARSTSSDCLSISIRSSLVFSKHKLFDTPSFAKLDLMYAPAIDEMAAGRVRTAFKIVHYALKVNGRLLLDDVAAVPPATLFAPVSDRGGLYRRLPSQDPSPKPSVSVHPRQMPRVPEAALAVAAQQVILEEYSPPIVLVKGGGEIVYQRRVPARWLTPATSQTRTLLPGLHEAVIEAAVGSLLENEVCERLIPDPSEPSQEIRLRARPVVRGTAVEPLTAVLLEYVTPGATPARGVSRSNDTKNRRHRATGAGRRGPERETEDLRRPSEAPDDADFQLLATCAELQTRNQELEIAEQQLSRENRKLQVANERLKANLENLEKAHDTVLSLLRTTDVATIALDDKLRVRNFNQTAASLFNLRSGDLRRPLETLTWNFRDAAFVADCREVTRNLGMRLDEVSSNDGRRWLRRITPYQTDDRRIDGVVATLTDVTFLNEANEKDALLATVLLDSRDAVVVFDGGGAIGVWNTGAERIFGRKTSEMLGTNISRFLSTLDGADPAELPARLKRGARIEESEFAVRHGDGSSVLVSLSASPVYESEGPPIAFALMGRDVTKERELEGAVIQAVLSEQRRIGQELHDGVGQELTGLGIQVETLVDALAETRHPESEFARSIGRNLRRTLSQVRTLSKGLIPVDVEGGDLREALATLAHRLQGQTQCAVEFSCDQSVEIADKGAATQLYRIAQEAITNGLKHSGADRIEVSLRPLRPGAKKNGNNGNQVETGDGCGLILSVADDGLGLEPERTTEGVGMSVMRYRAASIGARLSVERGAERGTTVQCVWNNDRKH
jgi:PAS domain S-box-containing protein